MYLLMDFGNTRFKSSILINDTFYETSIYEYNRKDFLKFKQHIKHFQPEIICYLTVRKIPKLIDNIINVVVKKIYNFPNDFKLPFDVRYETIETLGADRLAGVVGGVSLFPNENLLIIQMGTCITYDIFDRNIGYIGGMISPGIIIRNKAMHHFTSKLPLIDLYYVHQDQDLPELIGINTDSCIRSGIIHGIMSEIEGMISKISKQFPAVKVLLSGGDAQFFVNKIKYPIFAVPFLTLEGLKTILKNKL